MARPGLIENHPQRREIEAAILSRVPFRRIAAQFGIASEASVRRYVHDIMPAHLRAAYEREGESANADLIADVRKVYAALARLVDECDRTHDRQAKGMLVRAAATFLPFAKAIGEMRGTVEQDAPTAIVQVQVNYAVPEWMRARAIEGEVVEPAALEGTDSKRRRER